MDEVTAIDLVDHLAGLAVVEPAIGAEFLRTRDLTLRAASSGSVELAEAAGHAFRSFLNVIEEFSGEEIPDGLVDALRELVRTPPAPGEGIIQ